MIDKITHGYELNKFFIEEKPKAAAFIKQMITARDDEVDDIYQEAALALYNNIHAGKLQALTCALSTYFLSICRNQALKFISQKSNTVPITSMDKLTTDGEYQDCKIDEMLQMCTEDEDRRAENIVRRIIDSLPEKCHKIFWAYYWENLSTQTIAEEYGFANSDTVKAEKYRCVSKFKQRYQNLMSSKYGED
jgi:RNA polymerase sigma factor (sigma-70 family)